MSPQQVVGIQVMSTTRPLSVCLWHQQDNGSDSITPWLSAHVYYTLPCTVTLQLHNFDLFRTCRTSSFCTVAWQLARFQLTRRIARSLGDSWASCNNCLHMKFWENLTQAIMRLFNRSLKWSYCTLKNSTKFFPQQVVSRILSCNWVILRAQN